MINDHDRAMLWQGMREADRREMAAMHPGVSLRDVVNKLPAARSHALTIEGDFLGCYGVGRTRLEGALWGVPWMLCTEAIGSHALAARRLAAQKVHEWTEEFGMLINVADARNTVALRFVEALGFTVHPEKDGKRLFTRLADV